MALIIPAVFIAVFAFALFKRVKIYDEFSAGVGDAVKFTFSILPCLAAIFMMCELFEASGLSDWFTKLLSPAAAALGIPPELTKLILIKPFSGSGSLAYLTDIIRLVRDGVLYFRRILCGAEKQKACDARYSRSAIHPCYDRAGVPFVQGYLIKAETAQTGVCAASI